MPIRVGGFSIVSFLGSLWLWGLISQLPRFLSALKLLKNRQAMQVSSLDRSSFSHPWSQTPKRVIICPICLFFAHGVFVWSVVCSCTSGFENLGLLCRPSLLPSQDSLRVLCIIYFMVGTPTRGLLLLRWWIGPIHLITNKTLQSHSLMRITGWFRVSHWGFHLFFCFFVFIRLFGE